MFHPGVPPNNDWPTSWSDSYPYFSNEPKNLQYGCVEQGPAIAAPHSECGASCTWCIANVSRDHSVLQDQQIRDNCIEHLRIGANASSTRPFFVGCGFRKLPSIARLR